MDDEYYTDSDMSNAELINRDTFERLLRKKHRKKIVRRINYILLSFLMCIIFTVICMALFLKIENIEVTGNERYIASDIVQISGISEGQNMYSINKKDAIALITEKYPYINGVVIRRTLPSTLTFRITEDKAKYYTEICGEYFVLSETLRVLERSLQKPATSNDSKLIFIRLSDVSKAVVGSEVSFNKTLSFDYISSFFEIMSENEIEPKVSEIDISNKYNIYVYYEDRFKIYLGDTSNADMKLTFARLMIESFDADKRGTVDAHDISVGSVILEN